MKNLELNQMETVQGGNNCAIAVGLGVVVGIFGAVTGGLGWVIGGAGAAAMINEGCNE